MPKGYRLNFNLHSPEASCLSLQHALAEFAAEIFVREAQDALGLMPDEFCVSLYTEDPTLIFDACSQVGRIKSMRVEECSME